MMIQERRNKMASCYMTIKIVTTNGDTYYGAFSNDDVGYFFGGIAQNEEFTLKDALTATDGKSLIATLDKAYDNLLTDFEETSLFEEYEAYPLKASCLKDHGITGKIGGQSEVEALPVSQIQSIKIWEEMGGDEFGSDAELELDFVNKTERVFSKYNDEQGSRIHEELRHLTTGDVEILKDEFKGYENEDEE